MSGNFRRVTAKPKTCRNSHATTTTKQGQISPLYTVLSSPSPLRVPMLQLGSCIWLHHPIIAAPSKYSSRASRSYKLMSRSTLEANVIRTSSLPFGIVPTVKKEPALSWKVAAPFPAAQLFNTRAQGKERGISRVSRVSRVS